MSLVIDYREKELIEHLQCLSPKVEALVVGDAVCTYEDRAAWVMERKTAVDLAKSIVDGRWGEQNARLLGSHYGCVFLLIEGDLSTTSLPHENLLGACINAELRSGSHVIRTACVEETAMVIKQLVRKCATTCHSGTPSGIKPTSKRERDADTVFVRQLMCIPSVSERVARKLVEQFGTIGSLQLALRNLETFPRVRLDARTCIGKTRLQSLALYLA